MIFGVVILLGGAAYFTNKNGEVGVAAEAGYKVPPFTLPSYPDNQPISLSDFKGKPLLINFWASWCPPCQEETPDLVKAYAKYGNKVQFISVNLTAKDSLPDIKGFIDKYGIQYPVALDVNGTVTSQYNVVAIPTSIFVNRSGVIVARVTGAIMPQILESDLQRIMQ